MPDGGTVTIAAENRHVGADELPGCRRRLCPPGRHRQRHRHFAASDLEKVMEPFFTTKEVGKGSGLGLSMVYGFAKQSNGAFRHRERAWRRNDRRALAAARADARPAVAKDAARRSRSACQDSATLNVLLVDDHAEVRSTTAAVLEDSGHEVFRGRQRRRGARACSRRSDCEFDLLISDYAMPHLSGTEFLREARELCPDVPALIITGYAEPIASATARKASKSCSSPSPPTPWTRRSPEPTG